MSLHVTPNIKHTIKRWTFEKNIKFTILSQISTCHHTVCEPRINIQCLISRRFCFADYQQFVSFKSMLHLGQSHWKEIVSNHRQPALPVLKCVGVNFMKIKHPSIPRFCCDKFFDEICNRRLKLQLSTCLIFVEAHCCLTIP